MTQQNSYDLYERYLVPAMFVPAAQELARVAQPQPGERVLDIACGTGIVSRTLAPLVSVDGAVTGLDITPPMLAVARSIPQPDGTAPITWVEGSALSLPFEDHSFEIVTCQQAIQFFPDRLLALREMRRVLVSGGRAVIGVNQGFENNSAYSAFNDVLMRHSGIPLLAAPFQFGDPRALGMLFETEGFRDVTVHQVKVSVRFPNERSFVSATLFASGAAVAAFQAIDPAVRAAMLDPIHEDMRAIFAPYHQGDEVVFPLMMNIGYGVA